MSYTRLLEVTPMVYPWQLPGDYYNLLESRYVPAGQLLLKIKYLVERRPRPQGTSAVPPGTTTNPLSNGSSDAAMISTSATDPSSDSGLAPLPVGSASSYLKHLEEVLVKPVSHDTW